MRDLRGFTQKELAERSGCSQGFISRLEGHEKDASPEQRERMAVALSVPSEFLRQSGVYSGLGVSLVFFRKRQSALASHINRLQAEVCLRRLVLDRLLAGIDIGSTQRSFRFYDIDDYDGCAHKIAALVRASWHLPKGPIPNLVGIIESAGGVVFKFPFGTRDIDAMGQWLPNGPPLFFINSEAPTSRARFSLAHELGHVLMHRSASDEMEYEADRFASEFLMPEKDIAPELTSIDLSKAASMKPFWRVSMAALIRRAHDLNRIDRDAYRYLFTKMSRLGYRKKEPIEISGEEPQFFIKLIYLYQSSMAFSLSDLAAHVRMTELDFRDRFMPVSTGLRLVI